MYKNNIVKCYNLCHIEKYSYKFDNPDELLHEDFYSKENFEKSFKKENNDEFELYLTSLNNSKNMGQKTKLNIVKYMMMPKFDNM